MEAANVPVIPGCSECIYEADHGKRIAGEVGYPVMIKAALGGGGKGMRTAYSEAEFESAFLTAQSEAKMPLVMMPCILNILSSIRVILNFRFWQTSMEM